MPVQEQERVVATTPADPWRPPTSAPVSLAPAPRLPAAPRSGRPRGGGPRPAADLDVRLHAPLPQVVIVRVAGEVDQRGATLLAQRVGHQLSRAQHVVLDLGEVCALAPAGVDALTDLHRSACGHGTTLYLTGAEHDAIRGPLQVAGVDRLFVRAPSADAVTALHRPGIVSPPAAPRRAAAALR